ASWPLLLMLKISLAALLLLTVALHDIVLGPQTKETLEIPSERRTAFDRAVLATASWLPRFAIVLALTLVLAAVLLARS
ncbi:MAG TPA: hypothetical protein VK466_08215, partial [Terriglobales bacterium]|nr:hypothetical protein [Terriglobales bacterium]